MIGKCIRKKDNQSMTFKFKVNKLDLNFYVYDYSWQDVAHTQEDFERDYEFQDELSIGIIFHILFYEMIEDDYSPEVVKILNKNFQESVIAKELIEKEKIIRVICIKDIYGIDVYEALNDDDKIFICKNIYEGVYFIKSYYMLIGEKPSMEEVTYDSVNGKIVVTIPEHDTIKASFKNNFFIMNPDETKEDAWKRYQVKIATDRFDM
jgi:hypothetical protein